ncbi:MAG: undecaprenyl-phosphate glucose phosphotransferase [Chloroflexi bacterium]|nr:undecaprenyl-phosphate glucose phosphotransferase [Chloroflexota bacterium]
MRRIVGTYFTLGLILLDAAALVLSFRLAYWLRFESALLPVQEMHPWELYRGLVAFQAVALVAAFASQGLYRLGRSVSWTEQLARIFGGTSVAAVLGFVFATFTSPDFRYSELLISLAWGISIATVFLARWFYYLVIGLLRAFGVDEERVAIVGTTDLGRLIAERIRRNPSQGYRVVGFISIDGQEGRFERLPVLGSVSDCPEIVRQHRVEDLIIAAPGMSHQAILELAERCRHQRVNIRVFPDLFQIMASAVTINEVSGVPLIAVREVALKGHNIIVKRVMDIFVSTLALIFLAIPLMLIALLVKLTSPGDVFYIQERVGLDGKPFPLIKFRSMWQGAEAETGPIFAEKNDPRVTRLGAFLRRYSFDELPQLINVLLGHMSLVGPRPERPYFVEQFRRAIPDYYDRHQEKAGLTGWAQVNGLRGNTSIEERTAYDLWYAENWSLWLDIKILLRTLFVVFRDPNAR